MRRYQLADGSPLVLSRLTLAEWADEFGARLKALGCSDAYVARVRSAIRSAVPA